MSNTQLFAVRDRTTGQHGMVATVYETRDDATLAGDPALAVLTAITSLESARHAVAATGTPLLDLRYLLGRATAAPEPLLLALRAAGATLSIAKRGTAAIPLPASELELLDVSELAMATMAETTMQRLDVDDPRGAMRCLAHEPVPERATNLHEPEYWQRAFEWISLVAAALEERPGFEWVLAIRAGTIKQLGDRHYIGNHRLAPFDIRLGTSPVPLQLPELAERALVTNDFGPLIALTE